MTTSKRYIAMRAPRGDAELLYAVSDAHLRSTVDEAKADAAADIEYNGNEGGTYAIVEVIHIGKPTGMRWS